MRGAICARPADMESGPLARRAAQCADAELMGRVRVLLPLSEAHHIVSLVVSMYTLHHASVLREHCFQESRVIKPQFCALKWQALWHCLFS